MVNIAVVGIGNYGEKHVNAAKKVEDEGLARFVAAVTTRPEKHAEEVADLRNRGVEIYTSHTDMLAHHADLDLVGVPVPINLHGPITVEFLKRGVHVLVEKPPATTLAELEQMMAAAQASGKHCGVGFQYSVSPMSQALCGAIAAGKLGEITDVSVMRLGQRPDSYYARASWAGKLRHNGYIVHDGTINNPYAHMAQLLLSFAGAGQGRVARPVSVSAELYAGHDIESEDTSAIRATLDTGATFHFVASLCSPIDSTIGVLRVTGTRGAAEFTFYHGFEGKIDYHDGTSEPLPTLMSNDSVPELFRNFIAVIEGRASRLACPLEDTIGFMQLVEMVFDGERINHLANTQHVSEKTNAKGETETYIEGIDDIVRRAFEEKKLFSEVGAPWAAAPHIVERPLKR